MSTGLIWKVSGIFSDTPSQWGFLQTLHLFIQHILCYTVILCYITLYIRSSLTSYPLSLLYFAPLHLLQTVVFTSRVKKPFSEGLDNKYLKHAGQIVSVATTQLTHCSMKSAINDTSANGCGCPSIKLHFQKEVIGHICWRWPTPTLLILCFFSVLVYISFVVPSTL